MFFFIIHRVQTVYFDMVINILTVQKTKTNWGMDTFLETVVMNESKYGVMMLRRM